MDSSVSGLVRGLSLGIMGGIQEEAPGLGVPVLVMRDTTERPEGVEAEVARVVGTQRWCIVAEAGRLLKDAAEIHTYLKGRLPEIRGDSLKAGTHLKDVLSTWHHGQRG